MAAKLIDEYSKAAESDFAYSDGAIEQEWLASLQAGDSPEDILVGDSRFATLYHFSPQRCNLVRWLPWSGDESVLEIGAGIGALTGYFAQHCKSITANEAMPGRAKVLYERHKNYDNLEVVIGDFSKIAWDKKFDVVTLIGVLEYAGVFSDEPDPYLTLLRDARKRLRRGGVLLLAIENRFGIKYWAGANEDHYGVPYVGIAGYDNVDGARTFSRSELIKLLKAAGFSSQDCYLALPDYKFPREIIAAESEEFHSFATSEPVGLGEYTQCNFSEAALQSSISKEGWLQDFANSFLVIAKNDE